MLVLATGISCGSNSTTSQLASSPSPSVNAAAQSAHITCTKSGETVLGAEEVAAQRDGVHYAIQNDSGESASINDLGFDVEPGASTEVHGTKPGTVQIACYPFSRHDEPSPTGQPLHVADPRGFWIDPSLECETDAVESVTFDYGTGGGSRKEPVEVTRDTFSGIRADDVVERAAYPELVPPVVRVVRDEKTVASVQFAMTQSDGWRIGNLSSCPAAEIRGN